MARQKRKDAGRQNYSDAYINSLLDLDEEHRPVSNRNSRVVAIECNTDANAHKRSQREMEGLRIKLDKLANTKKPTRDPSCPEPIRCAKNQIGLLVTI